jgi:tRNA pseudouridine55 synthase
VRAIARDLGAALGVGGHLTALRRTAVGPFGLDSAHRLEALAEELPAGRGLVPLADTARQSFPAVELTDAQAADVRVGRRLGVPLDALTAVFAPDGEFLALYEPAGDEARAVAVFVG